MNKKIIIKNVLKAPLVLLGIGSFGGSIYATSTGLIQGVATPIVLGIIMVSYSIACLIKNNKQQDQFSSEVEIESPIAPSSIDLSSRYLKRTGFDVASNLIVP